MSALISAPHNRAHSCRTINASHFKSFPTRRVSSWSSCYKFQRIILSPEIASIGVSQIAAFCYKETNLNSNRNTVDGTDVASEGTEITFHVKSQALPSVMEPSKVGWIDHASFLLALVACATSIGFSCFVITAVPTLFAIRRTASSLSRLMDTASEELPSTLAAIRLSGMEICDLTLELSDLGQEITDGFSRSMEVVQVAKAGIEHIGTMAKKHSMSIIQERANMPPVSLNLLAAIVARKTSHVIGEARKKLMDTMS